MIEALLFDVFGTVVDWRTGVAREVEAFFADSEHEVDSVAFADSWRAKYQPSMEEIRSGRRGYTVLDVLHRENLNATLAEFGLDDAVEDEGRARLNRAWEKLPPWPDAVPGLNALHGRYLLAPCSNGSIAMMARLARSAGLPWDAIVGADIGRGYKPQSAVYTASAAALGHAVWRQQDAPLPMAFIAVPALQLAVVMPFLLFTGTDKAAAQSVQES